MRFCDGSIINDWVQDYHKILEGTNEILAKHSNELLTYLVKEGKEELKLRRLRLLEIESEKLKAKIARMSREKQVIAKSLEDPDNKNIFRYPTMPAEPNTSPRFMGEPEPRQKNQQLTKSLTTTIGQLGKSTGSIEGNFV